MVVEHNQDGSFVAKSLGKLKALKGEIKDRVVIENLEPDDTLFLPGIKKEHLARYNFAADLADKEFPNMPITVVDAGSARGYGSDLLANRLAPGSRVVGVELRHKYAHKAVQKYSPGNEVSPHFVQGEVQRIPLPNGTANLVTGFEITEHLPKVDQELFAREIERVLAPGGFAVLSVPTRYSFKEVNGELVRTGISSNPHHLYEPTREEMGELIKGSGLTLIGEFGQGIVSKNILDKVDKVSGVVPIRPFYAWAMPRDFSVVELPTEKDKVPLTQVFVAQKPPLSVNS